MITTHFHPWIGGAEKQVELIASWLVRHGIPVTVLTRGRGDLPARETHRGIHVVRVPVAPGKVASALSFLALGMGAVLRERHRFGVIHAHQVFSPSTLGWAASRLLGYPLVVNLHLGGKDGDLARLLRRPRSGRARLARLRRDAAAFVAISDEIASELRGQDIDESRIHLLGNAVDSEQFRPVDVAERDRIRERLGLPRGVPLAVYVGRLVPRKGVDLLVRAWARVPQPARLVVVGDGESASELRAAAERETPGRIRFEGARQAVDAYLKAADAWTLPSRGEGLPVSLLEAMSAALPVVTTPVGAIPEIVVDDRNGWLVPNEDVDALARALTRAVDRSPHTRRIGEEARRTILGRFAVDRVAESYRALFTSLTQPTGSRFGTATSRPAARRT
jgi:glycosyltransferase involved in cell wall biosynthesis